MTDFDEYSSKYKDVLDNSLRSSGYNADYFVNYKATYIINRVLNTSEGKLLDFGCGVGLLAGRLSRLLPNYIIHGYDISKESIMKVDKNLRESSLFTCDINDLHNDYDLIVVANVLHHIPLRERKSVIKQLNNRLKRKGRIVFFEHNPANPLTRRIVDKCPFDKDAVLLYPREIMLCLEEYSKVLRKDYIIFVPKSLALFACIEKYLAWCPLGAQYVIVGEKE